MSGADERAGEGASATLILMRVVFWGTAAILLGIAAFATQRTRSWLAQAERAPGLVVDLDVHRGSHNDVTMRRSSPSNCPTAARSGSPPEPARTRPPTRAAKR